jgi:hypothetical protein
MRRTFGLDIFVDQDAHPLIEAIFARLRTAGIKPR